jgi:dolichol-phosphate mannosyltransferase
MAKATPAIMSGLVSIVIPLFNEQETVEPLVSRLEAALGGGGAQWQFVFVNDGSRDETRERMLKRAASLPRWKFVRLSRNFGQQAPYRAGLSAANGDAVVFLDADLQDPLELIPDRTARWKAGARLVVGCRRSRAERGLRRALFGAFHALFHRVTGGVMPRDSGTFGLMDRAVVTQVERMPETNLFLPALRSRVGFQQDTIWYDRAERAGQLKQTLAKLSRYAWDGITSFSTVPLKAISALGLLISLFGCPYAGFLVVVRVLQFFGFFPDLVVQGFTTLAVAIFCLGGIQLLCLGIIGEYVAKVYSEVKGRPLYIVEEVLASPARHAS